MIVDTLSESLRAPMDVPPTYLYLLRSNFCPSDGESLGIKSLIEKHEDQLSNIKDEVERLKGCLAMMENRQAEVEELITNLHAKLAPIKRMPPEIMSQIFERCLVERPRDLLPLTHRQTEAPLLLGRVCSIWRTTSRATPRLWRDIHVSVCDGRYSDELRRDALPVLNTWLKHSGGLPLNLVVVCKTERLLPGLIELFDIITSNGPRWKTVRVRVQNSPAIYRLVSRAFIKCPSLSVLDITDSGQYPSPFGSSSANEVDEAIPLVEFDLRLAPLRRLSLSLAGLVIREVHAPWASLTSLSFMHDAHASSSSITDYLVILQQCISLKEYSITIDGGLRDAPIQPVTLPSLERLQLQALRNASHTTQLGDFLSAIEAPRLCSLAVDDYCPRRGTVLYSHQLNAFLRAHSHSLRHLRFSTKSKFFTSEDLVSLVSVTPLLTDLEYLLDEEASPNPLIAALTPQMTEDSLECLLPLLQRFATYWHTAETVAKVAEMVEMRYSLTGRGIARLKYLSCRPGRINIGHDCMPAYMFVEDLGDRLEPLRQQGLEVHWVADTCNSELFF